MVRFPKLPYKEFNSAGTASILEFLAFLGLSSRLLLVATKRNAIYHGNAALQGANRIVRQEEMLLNVDNSVIFAFLLASSWGPPQKLPKMARFLNLPYKEFNSAGTASILEFLAFWAFISGAFGGLQGTILNAPQEETLLTTEMRPSKEQIVLCDKKKYY